MVVEATSRPETAAGQPPAAPAGTRLYAVGDIHGRLDLLRALHLTIHADAMRRRAARNLIIYLGDYIDRGAQSKEVIDHLIDHPLPGFDSVHLKGNHEDILLRFLKSIGAGPNWFAFGGLETLASYRVDPPEPRGSLVELERVQRELAAKLPARHRDFLRRLALSHVEGDYFFAHAGIRPGVALPRQAAEDLLWIREDFLLSEQVFDKVVVHGHTIAPAPQLRRNRIGVDTGAYASGRLTCFVAQGVERSFLQT